MKQHREPGPVHVHVHKITPLHVRLRRNPCQNVKRPTSGEKPARQSSLRQQHDAEKQEDLQVAASQKLRLLLREQESFRRLNRPECQSPHIDELLWVLVEVEIDGVALSNQLTALKETSDNFAKGKRLSQSLGHQQGLLLEKIAMFNNTNHSLRELLRKWRALVKKSLAWSKERVAVEEALASYEAKNLALITKLANRDKEACHLAKHLDLEKVNGKHAEGLSTVLDSTCHILKFQLKKADAASVNVTAQIEQMEQSQNELEMELQALQEKLETVRKQKDKEVQLGEKTVTLLSQRVLRAEEDNKNLTEKIKKKESEVNRALSTSKEWCQRHSEEEAAKKELEEQVSALKLLLAQLDSEYRLAKEKSEAEREELQTELRQLNEENISIKVDTERVQSELTKTEERLEEFFREAHQLKLSAKKHEAEVERYHKKVQQARLESEENRQKVAEAHKAALEMTGRMEQKKERVKKKLLKGIKKLEPLPERIRRTEELLQEAQQAADISQKKNKENSSALSDVRHKVENQGAELQTFQHRNRLLNKENKGLKEKVQYLESYLERVSVANRELSQGAVVKEASIVSLEQQLEENTCYNSILTRQLQKPLEDAWRQVEDNVQRALVTEKNYRFKTLTLQSQLREAEAEMIHLRQSKGEIEHRLHGQLLNVKDRLHQSNSINRSLRNYADFLKTSKTSY